MKPILKFLFPCCYTSDALMQLESRLDNMRSLIREQNTIIKSLIKEGEQRMSVQLDKLTTEVTEIGSVVDSAIELISNLSEQILDLKDDPVALEALADELDAKAAALAEAVAANTVADDEIEPV